MRVMDFGLTEAAYTVVQLLRTYPVIRLPPGEKVKVVGLKKQTMSLVVSIANGCKVEANRGQKDSILGVPILLKSNGSVDLPGLESATGTLTEGGKLKSGSRKMGMCLGKRGGIDVLIRWGHHSREEGNRNKKNHRKEKKRIGSGVTLGVCQQDTSHRLIVVDYRILRFPGYLIKH
ncbi:hypothetical protein LTR06_011403 [Exophiala xenobiotica]|nr:hypothetical protein LTR06_011403 [Exophiala xenobiotica]